MTDYTEYLEYKTVGGERWDRLADQFYGDALLYEPIIRANPHVNITAELNTDIILKIPILKQDDLTYDNGGLPPWQE